MSHQLASTVPDRGIASQQVALRRGSTEHRGSDPRPKRRRTCGAATTGRARRRADHRRGPPLQPAPDHPRRRHGGAEAAEERPGAGHRRRRSGQSRRCSTWPRPASAPSGIVEFDTVDESNLQRQIIHGQSDVGKSKAESARESIAETNPFVNVVVHDVRLDNDNVMEIFSQYDLIVDGTDNFATRYLVNDAAVLLGKPYVWGSIYRFDGQASVFWAEHGPCYRCLYPEPPPPGHGAELRRGRRARACSARRSGRSR